MSTAASIYFSHTHYDIKYVQIQNISTATTVEDTRTTMVDPKDYSRNKHASWKRFLQVLLGSSPTKSTHITNLFRGSSLPTSPDPLRRIECHWNLLPPEQPRVVIPYSQRRRRYDMIMALASAKHLIDDDIENRAGSSGLKKGVNVFLKPASLIEPSRGINQTSNAGKPEALATGTIQLSCSERRLFRSRSIGG